MKEKYRRYPIAMAESNSAYRMWKNWEIKVSGFVEVYKGKYGILIQSENLEDRSDQAKEYHILFLGEGEEKPLYLDVGQIKGDARGIGKFYGRGEEDIMKYEELLIVCIDKDSAIEDVVCRQRLPFAIKRLSPWESIFLKAQSYEKTEPPFEDVDDAPVQWRKVPWEDGSYGHILIGATPDYKRYVAFPGRFMRKEQPEVLGHVLTLWIPLKGAESYLTEEGVPKENKVEEVYGYWIGTIDEKGNVSEV